MPTKQRYRQTTERSNLIYIARLSWWEWVPSAWANGSVIFVVMLFLRVCIFFPFYVSMVAKSPESLLISEMLLLLLRTLDSFFFHFLLALIGDWKAAGWSYKHNSTHKLWLFVCGNRVNGMISIVTWARCIRISRITLWLATSNVYVCVCVRAFIPFTWRIHYPSLSSSLFFIRLFICARSVLRICNKINNDCVIYTLLCSWLAGWLVGSV